MKKVSFIVAGLVSLLLVGCGGSEGSVSSATDSIDNSVETVTPSTDVISLKSANNAVVQDGLPSIPDIPNE